MPGTPFNVDGVQNCAAPCVHHIRFATDLIGYAYSSDVLFMTTDGGSHWQPQPGRGAEALETLDGNVIRLVSDRGGCPGPCNVHVETALLGTSTWTTVHLQPGDIDPVGVQLSRSGSDAYVLATGRTAGGAADQTSTLYISTDNGASWNPRSEPCPQASAQANKITTEVDSVAVAAAPGGAVSLLCASRDGVSRIFAIISRDTGTHFTQRTDSLPRSAGELLTGDPSTVLIAAGTTAYRLIGAGPRWVQVAGLAGRVSFLGFESATVGRAVTDAGRKIETTTDGGRTWSSFEFP